MVMLNIAWACIACVWHKFFFALTLWHVEGKPVERWLVNALIIWLTCFSYFSWRQEWRMVLDWLCTRHSSRHYGDSSCSRCYQRSRIHQCRSSRRLISGWSSVRILRRSCWFHNHICRTSECWSCRYRLRDKCSHRYNCWQCGVIHQEESVSLQQGTKLFIARGLVHKKN